MNKFVQAVSQHDTVTDNGAVTHSTSLNPLVDMFFLAGASRTMSETDIISVFIKAFTTNAELAIKCLFWARDCRGGAGEKRFFRVIMSYLKEHYKDVYEQIVIHTPEYGSWKDIFKFDTPDSNSGDWVQRALTERDDNLCAKWMPRKGAWFECIRKELDYTPKQMRQLLVKMTKVVETQMCANQWSAVEYSKVPSKAFQIYKRAFDKRDNTRFQQFITDVQDGKEKLNSGQLFPYELYQSYNRGEQQSIINEQWKALPDYVKEGNFLPVCDVSGSMEGLPMDISVSLGVYLSERNKGIFKDAFITFSNRPKMEYLKGTVCERFAQLHEADWEQNTNLQAVFNLVLTNAKRANLLAEDMPNTLLIISDMEFDEACAGNTNYESIQNKYQLSGYKCPNIAFWNVNGRIGNVPVNANQQGVSLISGASPSIIKSVLEGKDFTPIGIMLETLNSERYKRIKV